MQPDPSERSSTSPLQQSLFGGPFTPSQHGLSPDVSPSGASPPDRSVHGGDSTEWSLSPSTSVSGWGSPAGFDTGLSSSAELAPHDFRLDSPSPLGLTEVDLPDNDASVRRHASIHDEGFSLHEFPEGMARAYSSSRRISY